MRTPLRLQPTPSFRYSPLVAALACVLAPHASMAATYTVVNANEFGPGSLYQAIEDANADPMCGVPDSVQIQFSGAFVINMVSVPLPQVTCARAVLEGLAGGTKTVIDGSAYVYGGCGLSASVDPYVVVRNFELRNWNGAGLCGNHLTVQANLIHGNETGIQGGSGSSIGDGSAANRNYIYANNTGIYVSYGGSVNGNFIGTADGVTAQGNITGIAAETNISITNNVISANNSEGIYIQDGSGITISGNKIGTNEAGTAALGNEQSTGIYLEFSYGGPVISNNTISGNASTGVAIVTSGTITLNSNRIGTNGSGTAAIPNGTGVEAYCVEQLQITSNTISGNSGSGVYLAESNNSNLVGNRIGVASSGTASIPNDGDGINLAFGGCGGGFDRLSKRAARGKSLMIGGSNNNVLQNNIIANNSGEGIAISSGGQNRLAGNSVHSNGGKNIALDMYGGPLPNDTGDGDDGVNSLQNWPVVDAVSHVGGNTQISFTLDSLPSLPEAYEIQIFKNAASGPPSGQTFMASTFLPVSSGPTPGSFTLTGLHDHISLTAIAPNGDTSELSIMGDVQLSPNRTINPTTLNFASVPIDTTSTSRTVTIASNGTAPYEITSISSGGSPSCYGGPICYGGDFMCSTTCSTFTPYAPGQSCQVTGTFAPSFLGPQSTTLYVCDNVNPGVPTAITLLGNGVVPPPVSISPLSHNFGDVALGTASAVRTFTVTNPSSVDVSIYSITSSGHFRLVTNTCGSTLAGGSSCAAGVAFDAVLPGQVSGVLTVSLTEQVRQDFLDGKRGNARAGKSASAGVSAQLFGTGVAGGGLTMPSSVDLGTYLIGSPPNQQTVELRNNGSAPVNLSSISFTGPFTLVNDCPATLAAGESCLLLVGFSSSAEGGANGTLTVLTDATGGSRTIPITALAQRVPRPLVRVSPVSIGFGDRLIGTQSAAQRITVVNDGGATANLSSIGSNSVEFLVTNTSCGATLAAASTCFADVAMRPLGFSGRTGRISFSSNSEGSPHGVSVFGTGCRPNSASGGRFGNRGNCSP